MRGILAELLSYQILAPEMNLWNHARSPSRFGEMFSINRDTLLNRMKAAWTPHLCHCHRDNDEFTGVSRWTTVVISSIMFRQNSSKSTALIGIALCGLAVAGTAIGAVAIGALAIGALGINKMNMGTARIEKLTIGKLTVDELIVKRRSDEANQA
jgi:hypothetical protein